MNRMYYSKEDIIQIFENRYKSIIENGKFNFDINWKGFYFIGPSLVKSTKNYYLHKISVPITGSVYWIKISNGVYYKFDVQPNGCHNLLHLSRSRSESTELTEDEQVEFLKFLTETEQFQGLIYLMICICRICNIRSVVGGIFDNVLSPLLDENGDITINVHKSSKEEIILNDNVLHISLF